MSEPFMGEIKICAFNFAPKGWTMCNGQLLPINQNQALFSLLGTTFGGDGRVNFALPKLAGCVAIGSGASFTLGQFLGEENHTITQSEMPSHNHVANATNTNANKASPVNTHPAATSPTQVYSAGGGAMQAVAMNAAMVSNFGGSQSHPNMMPYLVTNFIIALQGIFPSRN